MLDDTSTDLAMAEEDAEEPAAVTELYVIQCVGAKLQVRAKLQLGPSCRLPTASPGRWIGGRPPDMVASCDLSG